MAETMEAKRGSLVYTRQWSSLEEVAGAVSISSSALRQVYVERLGDRYRWSMTHRGGAYPLLRTAARYVEIDYQRLTISCRSLPDGSAVMCENPESFDEPDAWAVLDVDNESPLLDVEILIAAKLSKEEER